MDSPIKNIGTLHNCYGCGVCAIACSPNAISLIKTPDGFFAPKVDSEKCINCGLCLKVCSFYEQVDGSGLVKASYASFSIDNDIRYKCSSGGVGYELGRWALENGYVFCGALYDAEKGRVEHYLAHTLQELELSRGSKYLQSFTLTGFSQFKPDKKYLVVATPCQIASLRKYISLKHRDEDFILIDFFCHGVPSYLLWEKYLGEMKEITGNVHFASWRGKQTGWHDSWVVELNGDNGSSISWWSKGDIFYRFFLRNRCLNTCCYDNCRYKDCSSMADLRIGDLWGTKYESNHEGVNGILVFTDKGNDILQKLNSRIELISEPINVVTQVQLKNCPKRPSTYNYVTKALRSNVALTQIDKKANRKEWFVDKFPSMIRYYMKRISQIILFR